MRVPALGWFALAPFVGFFTFAIATGFLTSVQRVLHLPPGRMSTPLLQAGYGWGMIVLLIAVQPAVIEELAFRGIILTGLQRVLKPGEAVVASALMFMVLHLDPMRFPHTLALGLAAGLVRIRAKSIFPCIAIHFTHNFLCLAFEWAGK
jgi:membrane protease YdiL (CAAX protease family)